MKLLMVSVGAGRYAIAADVVARIMDPSLDPAFRSDGEGAIAIHDGARYPIVTIEPGAEQRGALYLLLARSGSHVVLQVDSATSVEEIPGAAIAPLPSFIFEDGRRPVRGIFSDGGTARLLVDLDALL